VTGATRGGVGTQLPEFCEPCDLDEEERVSEGEKIIIKNIRTTSVARPQTKNLFRTARDIMFFLPKIFDTSTVCRSTITTFNGRVNHQFFRGENYIS